ncbi:hypothetical protein [Verrucosispora sp. ts21]|uniref:hypothetical protein n=1 Tax=Verrucosispora sp. ts21 TaxID=2069341 RepID=UPI0011AEDC9F|nr:hypothetical protein [Verrucosispora sp. ts21]
MAINSLRISSIAYRVIASPSEGLPQPTDDGAVPGSADGTTRVWADRVDLDELTAVARTRVFRGLTDDERRAHLLPVDADS